MSSLTDLLAEAIRAAVTPLARRAFFTAGVALVVVLSLAIALGFAAAGLYLVAFEQLRLSGSAAAFAVAGVFAVVAAATVLWLRSRRTQDDAPVAVATAVEGTTARALEDTAARAVETRPVAALAACVAAGVIVSVLGGGSRR